MNLLGPWTTSDFDAMSWHDVHVHGFRLDAFNPRDGSADLTLDLDYILKWEKAENGFLFTLSRAELVFHEVFGLQLNLDYATPTAGTCPFSISGIEREPVPFPAGSKSFSWRLPVNWPSGSIVFQSPGFSQGLLGDPVVHSGQFLSPEQRGGAVAA
jgi:hypothetical protein